ncbi:MAG TPA: patatin-like phospholipase family protein [Thermoanaerobaculia bacterium]|nr:patatin-like phospholipase family protein [Thermoanaerobaculia bacterium]
MTASRTELRGVDPEAVLEVIRERARRQKAGESIADGRKLALVVEGGGMRGIYSAGSVVGLEFLGVRDVFDHVYGTSAGAINAAYYLAGQGSLGITIYYQDIDGFKFVNPLRLTKIADIDFVYDEVIPKRKPLDVERVLASRSRFFIALTDVDTGAGFLVQAQEASTPLIRILKGSAALPVGYNRPVEVEGRRCLDGGTSHVFAIREALEHGCTDILVLLTRPEPHVSNLPGAFGRGLFSQVCARGKRDLLQTYLDSHRHNNACRDLAFGRAEARPGVRIATLCPDDDEVSVTRYTTNARVLKAAAIRMTRKMMAAFGKPSDGFAEVLHPFWLPRL